MDQFQVSVLYATFLTSPMLNFVGALWQKKKKLLKKKKPLHYNSYPTSCGFPDLGQSMKFYQWVEI